MNLLTQILKSTYNGLIIIFQILWILVLMLIRGKQLPGFLDTLDDKFTHNFKPWQRERIIKGFNRIFSLRPIWWLMCMILKRVAKGEMVDIDTKSFLRKKHKSAYSGLLHIKMSRHKWANWMKNQQTEPLCFHIVGNVHPLDADKLPPAKPLYDFETLDKLFEIAVTNNPDKRKVRAVASGHALSDVALTNDIMISTMGLTSPQRMADKTLLKDSVELLFNLSPPGEDGIEPINKPNRYLFEIGAGLKIYALNHYLDELGLALLNQGGTDVQGFMGAVSTSTHGSGIGLGPMPDMVKSMVVIAADGNKYRIEPTKGITDPKKYEQSEDLQLHDISLIQDDDIFYSFLVSMGCMGIVYSVIIEVRNRYYLEEERRLTTWEKIRKDLLADPIPTISKTRHFEISINPYTSVREDYKDQHTCLVTTRNPIPAFGKENKGEAFTRNFVADVMSGLHLTGPLSVWLFNTKPENMPKMIENSLKRLQDNSIDGGGFHGKSNVVLNQGLERLRDTGYAIEICFPIEKFVAGIDRILEITQEMAEKYNIYNPAPLALRFVDKSNAYMSMMHDQVSCTVEVVTLRGIAGANVLLQRIEEEMFAFGGRPHWGLNLGCISSKKERIMEAYPKFETWLEVYEKFNPDGMYDNGFTRRCGFRNIISEKKKLAEMNHCIQSLQDHLPNNLGQDTSQNIAQAIDEIKSGIHNWFVSDDNSETPVHPIIAFNSSKPI